MAIVWQYQQKAEPLATAVSSGALTEDGIVGFLPRQPAIVPGPRRGQPGFFSFVADDTPAPVIAPTRPFPPHGELPPRGPQRFNVGPTGGQTFFEEDDLRRRWICEPSQPTYRKRQQAGTYAESLEPSLKLPPPANAWEPRLAIPPRAKRAEPGWNAVLPRTWTDPVTGWLRQANPVPIQPRRPSPDANVWRWVPESVTPPLLAVPQNPRGYRYPTHSPAFLSTLVIPYEATPDALTQPPGNPVLRPTRPEGLIVRAIPPVLIRMPHDWMRPTSQPTYRKRATPGHVAELDGWDVRPVAYLRTNPVPEQVRRRPQPTHYGEYIDGYRYCPLPPHQLLTVARRMLTMDLAPASVPVPYEQFPAAWTACYPDKIDGLRRVTVEPQRAAFPVIGWYVYPSQFVPTLQPLPGRTPPAKPWSGMTSDIYPSWEIPLAGYWRLPEIPQARDESIRWLIQAATDGRVLEWVYDATGRLVWKADDPGILWRWERDMGFTRPATLAKKTTWTRNYYFDFAAYAERQAGVTIASATVTADVSGLTIGTPAINGDRVMVNLSGGQRGTTYLLTCTVTMQNGAVISQQGYLSVE